MKLVVGLLVIVVCSSAIIAAIFMYPISAIHVHYRTWGLFIVGVAVASLIGGGYAYLSHPDWSTIDRLLYAIPFVLITALLAAYFALFIILNVHGEGSMPIPQVDCGESVGKVGSN